RQGEHRGRRQLRLHDRGGQHEGRSRLHCARRRLPLEHRAETPDQHRRPARLEPARIQQPDRPRTEARHPARSQGHRPPRRAGRHPLEHRTPARTHARQTHRVEQPRTRRRDPTRRQTRGAGRRVTVDPRALGGRPQSSGPKHPAPRRIHPRIRRIVLSAALPSAPAPAWNICWRATYDPRTCPRGGVERWWTTSYMDRIRYVRMLVLGGIVFALSLPTWHALTRDVIDEEETPIEAALEKAAGAPEVGAQDGRSTEWDLPATRNARVDYWIDFLKGRNKDRTRLWLERMGRYEEFIRGKLRERGMPEDLIYLALIESGFSPVARSHASAVGFWQFIAE